MISSSSCYGWFSPAINYLLDPESPEPMTESQISWLIAITSVGEIFGSLTAGVMSDKWGRKTCILLTGPIFFLSWIVVVFTKSYVVFLFVRIAQGIAVSTVFAVVPVYLGEISSPSKRGRITALFSIGWFLGFLLEYCLGTFLSYKDFTLLTASVPLIYTILIPFQPESPYYFIIKRKEAKATATLEYLRKNSSESSIERELQDIKSSIAKDLENKCSWKNVVATSADRRALFIVLIIGFTRIGSGEIALITYSTNLFFVAGTSFLSPNVLTIIVGLALLLGGLVNSIIVNSFGRRPLIFISCIGCFISVLIVGIFFFLKQETNIDVSFFSLIVPLGVITYCIFNVIGLFPVTIAYTFELFTSKTRSKGASISTINSTLSASLTVKLHQIINDYFGLYTVFWYYSTICLLGGVLLFYLAPETKEKTLTQIRSELFNVRKRKNVTNKIRLNI